jgi:hypothetical protein
MTTEERGLKMASFKTLDLPLEGAFKMTSNNSLPCPTATSLFIRPFKGNLGSLVLGGKWASCILLQKKDTGCMSPAS